MWKCRRTWNINFKKEQVVRTGLSSVLKNNCIFILKKHNIILSGLLQASPLQPWNPDKDCLFDGCRKLNKQTRIEMMFKNTNLAQTISGWTVGCFPKVANPQSDPAWVCFEKGWSVLHSKRCLKIKPISSKGRSRLGVFWKAICHVSVELEKCQFKTKCHLNPFLPHNLWELKQSPVTALHCFLWIFLICFLTWPQEQDAQ